MTDTMQSPMVERSMSLNMLIEFGDAFDYTGSDFREWCGEAGFKRFEIINLAAQPVLLLRTSKETIT